MPKQQEDLKQKPKMSLLEMVSLSPIEKYMKFGKIKKIFSLIN